MAATFWESNCSLTLVSKQRLEEGHAEDKLLGLTSEQVDQLKGHFTSAIYELARLCKLRQRVAATAVIYFRRVYLCNTFCRLDPRLVYVASLYLASKAEESLLAAKHLVTYAKKLRPSWQYDVKDLLDMEMVLLEDLDFTLVVFAPYRDASIFLKAAFPGPPYDHEFAQQLWAVVNDSYRTDLSLMYAPHIVALGCLYFTAMAHKKDVTQWMQTLNVSTEEVFAVAMGLSNLYAKHRANMSIEDCNRMLDLVQAQRWDSAAVVVSFDRRR